MLSRSSRLINGSDDSCKRFRTSEKLVVVGCILFTGKGRSWVTGGRECSSFFSQALHFAPLQSWSDLLYGNDSNKESISRPTYIWSTYGMAVARSIGSGGKCVAGNEFVRARACDRWVCTAAYSDYRNAYIFIYIYACCLPQIYGPPCSWAGVCATHRSIGYTTPGGMKIDAAYRMHMLLVGACMVHCLLDI
jgi:hypothetical protein